MTKFTHGKPNKIWKMIPKPTQKRTTSHRTNLARRRDKSVTNFSHGTKKWRGKQHKGRHQAHTKSGKTARKIRDQFHSWETKQNLQRQSKTLKKQSQNLHKKDCIPGGPGKHGIAAFDHGLQASTVSSTLTTTRT